jgi:hypothetical protein
MASASHPHQLMWMNKNMKSDLCWLFNHVQSFSCINVLTSTAWDIADPDSTVFCDASLKGLGFWYPELSLGFFTPVNFNIHHCTGIYFLEALCIASAIHKFKSYLSTSTAVIFTDSEDTVDMFNSFHTTPFYNPILTSAVDETIVHSCDIHVLHVEGIKNKVADALSCGQFHCACQFLISSLRNLSHLKTSCFLFAIFYPLGMHWGDFSNDFLIVHIPAACSATMDFHQIDS